MIHKKTMQMYLSKLSKLQRDTFRKGIASMNVDTATFTSCGVTLYSVHAWGTVKSDNGLKTTKRVDLFSNDTIENCDKELQRFINFIIN